LFSFFFLHIATPFDERLVERRIRISLYASWLDMEFNNRSLFFSLLASIILYR
jgi:hypothetical protein